VIAANQPVEPVSEGLALEAKLLAEGLEAVERTAVARTGQNVEIVEVRILAAGVLVVPIGGDRGQFGAAQIVGELTRQAIIPDPRIIVPARGDRHAAGERIVVDERAEAALDECDGRRLRPGSGDVLRGEVGRAAAFLVQLRIIADQPKREIVVRLVEDLPAKEPPVPAVDPASGNDVSKESVALKIYAVDPRRDRVGERPGDAALEAAQIEIADLHLTVDLGGEAGLGGDDRNEAGRRVAAEEGALRPAEDLDSVERPQLGERHAGARAIDAVDEDANGAFEPRVVADGADAADASDSGAALGRRRRDEQRGGDLVQLADVGRAG